MCLRVLNWSDAHPDEEPGHNVLVAQLKGLAARMGQVIADQRRGLVESRAASARKGELRQEMLSGAIAHLARIGGLAAREKHELAKLFQFKPTAGTFLAFQSAARQMLEAAHTYQEVLVKYGLSESILNEFGKQLDEFDAVINLGLEARTLHTAATRELEAKAREVRKIVRAMDARNRQRFRDDRQALELWISARTVLGTPRGSSEASETPAPAAEGGTPRVAGDVRPAA
jgi:hypothetical protein